MLKWETIDRAHLPDDGEMFLVRRGDEWALRAGNELLMTSRVHGSEEALARVTLERANQPRDILIGGLGMGYTLRAALDRLAPSARVVVVELLAELVSWNRGPLAELAGRPLGDPRVEVRVGDVRLAIQKAQRAWDVILLDIDNGPTAVTTASNDRLYGATGLAACRQALKPGGLLAVWSASLDHRFRARLGRAGFDSDVIALPKRHAIYLARCPKKQACRLC